MKLASALLCTLKSTRATYPRDGTHAPTRTCHSPLAVAATRSQNDGSLIDSTGHTIGRLSSKCHRWFSRKLVNQLRPSGKLIWSYCMYTLYSRLRNTEQHSHTVLGSIENIYSVVQHKAYKHNYHPP